MHNYNPIFSSDGIKAKLVLVAYTRCTAHFVAERNVNPGLTVHNVSCEGWAGGAHTEVLVERIHAGEAHMEALVKRIQANCGSSFT